MTGSEVIVGKVQTPVGEMGAMLTERGLARLTLPGEPYEECEVWAARWEPLARKVANDARLRSI